MNVRSGMPGVLGEVAHPGFERAEPSLWNASQCEELRAIVAALG
jgi:hypothetical protein